MAFILGKKLGMTQVFKENEMIPVTLVKAGPCEVTQIKNEERDGYEAIQLGLNKEDDKKFKHYCEFRTAIEDFEVGQKIKADNFEEGQKVSISGRAKGKGFQGGVKKWGFSGRDKGHGGKGQVRTTGAIGGAYPQRVWPGKKMPGRAGGQRTTVRNLEIVEIDPENNLLAIKGSVPGAPQTLLEIKTIS